MKKIAIITMILGFLAACDNPQEIGRTSEGEYIVNIPLTITPYSPDKLLPLTRNQRIRRIEQKHQNELSERLAHWVDDICGAEYRILDKGMVHIVYSGAYAGVTGYTDVEIACKNKPQLDEIYPGGIYI